MELKPLKGIFACVFWGARFDERLLGLVEGKRSKNSRSGQLQSRAFVFSTPSVTRSSITLDNANRRLSLEMDLQRRQLSLNFTVATLFEVCGREIRNRIPSLYPFVDKRLLKCPHNFSQNLVSYKRVFHFSSDTTILIICRDTNLFSIKPLNYRSTHT